MDLCVYSRFILEPPFFCSPGNYIALCVADSDKSRFFDFDTMILVRPSVFPSSDSYSFLSSCCQLVLGTPSQATDTSLHGGIIHCPIVVKRASSMGRFSSASPSTGDPLPTKWSWAERVGALEA